jgi:hypothetical protein
MAANYERVFSRLLTDDAYKGDIVLCKTDCWWSGIVETPVDDVALHAFEVLTTDARMRVTTMKICVTSPVYRVPIQVLTEEMDDEEIRRNLARVTPSDETYLVEDVMASLPLARRYYSPLSR